MKLQNLIHIVIGILCIGLFPRAQAVVPPPDGGYPGFNTAAGTNALKNLTTGVGSAAVGWYSLFTNSSGSYNTGVGAGTLALNDADQNTAIGAGALLLNTTGGGNTANGALALLFNTSGFGNTATGLGALQNNTTGNFNTANGANALLQNTVGLGNTASGFQALKNNDTGFSNTAAGSNALSNNISGSDNTAIGTNALVSNTESSGNTATGASALFSNSTGASNTANGAGALFSNTTGEGNTAMGDSALHDNTTGGSNTAMGESALVNNNSLYSTAIGRFALFSSTSGSQNTAVGYQALYHNTTGHNNTALGLGAGFAITGDGNICIGLVDGEPDVNNTTYIANVNTLAQNFSAGVNNYVTVRMSDGRLGNTAVVSSRRYKEEIKPLAATSEGLYALEPVSFRLKKEYDNTQALGFGLIAEEVEKVNSDLVYRNDSGQVESVRYEMVNAMLLNEFLKEHREVQELKKQVAALTAGLQKVSAQIEASRPAPQVVINP